MGPNHDKISVTVARMSVTLKGSVASIHDSSLCVLLLQLQQSWLGQGLPETFTSAWHLRTGALPCMGFR